MDSALIVLVTWKDDPMNRVMELEKIERIIEFGAENRQSNVSLDNQINPEGVMTMF